MLSADTNADPHSLPPFANASNKQLHVQLRDKEAQLNSCLAILDDSVSRSDAMSGHMKNVRQELAHTQALFDAKTRQIEGEDHLKQLAERESGRLTLEIRNMEKEIADISDHLSTIQNNIYRGNERIDAIRTELKLEKDELDEWLRVQAEKEEDSMALLKYSKEDDLKIKDLSLQIEKLVIEVNKKNATLSAEVTETQVAQIELEKATEEFKTAHRERQELIKKWEESIKNMQRTDQTVADAQDKYQQLKSEIQTKQAVIDEKQTFLDQQLQSNTETEKKIANCDRHVSKFRLELAEENAGYSQFQDEVEVLRSTLNKTATDLVSKRGEIVDLKAELQERQSKLEKEKTNKSNMKRKLADVQSDTMTMEERSKQLQEILKEEEIRNKNLDRELKILRETQFKKSQELFRLKQEEKNLRAEITGGEAAVRNLQSKINKLDQEALKQQALLYAQEFQIQQLERKVRRAQGDRTDEEKEILLKKIEDLNAQLEEQTQKWVLLSNQLKKSQSDLRQATRKLETLRKEKQSVLETIDSLNFYNESAGNQLAAKTAEKEELMVEENILRLELRKLRGFLNIRADEVFTLENRQVQLQLALEERKKEIDIHKDMLRLRAKNIEEERYSANAELRERVGKVEKLKRRYEILMTQFAPEEGQEEHSQAYYVIKAAQEREELQREGDELDSKIRKAEKEIKGLENTLKLMNDRNEEYRANLYKAELNSTDVQHKEMLEQQYKTTMERYKTKRQEIQDLQQDLLNLERSLSLVSGEEANRSQAVQAMENKLAILLKEVKEQEAKRDRAYKLLCKLSKELRKAEHTTDATESELDFRTRAAKDIGSLVMGEIGRLSEQYPEVALRFQQLIAEYQIQPPSRVLSRVASRADNIGDDMSMSSGSSSGRRSVADDRGSVKGMSRSSSRSSTGMRLPSRISTSRPSSSGRAIKTMDMNASVTLPPPASKRGASTSQTMTVSLPSATPAQGYEGNGSNPDITGSGRIKSVARPGSATSMSSHNSASSRHSAGAK